MLNSFSTDPKANDENTSLLLSGPSHSVALFYHHSRFTVCRECFSLSTQRDTQLSAASWLPLTPLLSCADAGIPLHFSNETLKYISTEGTSIYTTLFIIWHLPKYGIYEWNKRPGWVLLSLPNLYYIFCQQIPGSWSTFHSEFCILMSDVNCARECVIFLLSAT